MFPVDPRDFVSQNKDGDATTCIANNLVATDPPSRGALFSWSLGDPFLKSNLVAFYYGNLTHPSVDPPRIGFKSQVPQNASAELKDVVADAQESGGVFESACSFLNIQEYSADHLLDIFLISVCVRYHRRCTYSLYSRHPFNRVVNSGDTSNC